MPMITVVYEESVKKVDGNDALGYMAEKLRNEFPEEEKTFILRGETIETGDFIILKGGEIGDDRWLPVIKVVLSERNGREFTARLLKVLAEAAAEAFEVDSAAVTVYSEYLGAGCFYVNNKLV